MAGMAVVETNSWPISDSLTTAEAEWVYQRWPELKTQCPTCTNTGSYRWRGQTFSCDCVRQKQLAKRYTLAGIGVTYQRLNWDDFHGSDRVLAEIEHYLTNWRAYVDRGVGFIFTGDYGTGKTMMGNLILKELVKRGVRCYATTFAETIEEFTKSWGDPEQKRWFENQFKYTKVLLLDDLGRETRSKNNLPQSTFDSILRPRTQNARPTILTTNIAFKDLDVAGYGSAVLSLLKETSVEIELKGDDFRPRRREHTLDEIAIKEVRPIV